jgi:heme A synthase
VSGVALLAAQVAVGAFDALLGAPAALADVHLAPASALWAVVIAVAYRSKWGTGGRTVPVGSSDVERTVFSTAGPEDY